MVTGRLGEVEARIELGFAEEIHLGLRDLEGIGPSSRVTDGMRSRNDFRSDRRIHAQRRPTLRHRQTVSAWEAGGGRSRRVHEAVVQLSACW